MDIKKIAVIGGGTMGNGIAHVFAMKGFDVFLTEMDEEFYERAVKTISGNLDRQVKKQLISDSEKNQTLSRINKVIGVENIPSDVNLIIEAIYENKDAKISIFKQLENQVNPDCIFA
nr:3-hydroxyacyl-CoA dehydrogenase NAD-binding domain-containing protein [Ignavibacterium sp.]